MAPPVRHTGRTLNRSKASKAKSSHRRLRKSHPAPAGQLEASFPLMALPPELRNHIYAYALHLNGPAKCSSRKSAVQLLRASKKIYQEAKGFLYSENTPTISLRFETFYRLWIRQVIFQSPTTEGSHSQDYGSLVSSALSSATNIDWEKNVSSSTFPLGFFKTLIVQLWVCESDCNAPDATEKFVAFASQVFLDLACYSKENGGHTRKILLRAPYLDRSLFDGSYNEVLKQALWPLTYIRDMVRIEGISEDVRQWVMKESAPLRLSRETSTSPIRSIYEKIDRLGDLYYIGTAGARKQSAKSRDALQSTARRLLKSEERITQDLIDNPQEMDRQLDSMLGRPIVVRFGSPTIARRKTTFRWRRDERRQVQ